MSRARDNANLGTQAGSGLDASDITTGALPVGVTGGSGLDAIRFLENNTSTQTLSGTYSTERLYFNDEYQLTGNVTVTGHLALGTIADEDVVITNDGTERTITGEGTLESGNVLQDIHRTSLTDMTGTLGSVVTGSPNLNLTTGTLGSGVTFPPGHILQVRTGTLTVPIRSSIQDWNDIDSDLVVSITLSDAQNKVLVMWNGGIGQHSGWTPVTRVVRDYPSATTVCSSGVNTEPGAGPAGMSISPGYADSSEEIADQAAHFSDSPNVAGTAIEYRVQWRGRTDATGYNYINRMSAGYDASHYGSGISTISLWEIKG